MDIVRLDRDSFLPDAFVEGLNSKIWAERFRVAGEFELKTYRVKDTLKLLPEMSLISHLQTDEVMFVENRSIKVDKDGVPLLTIKGRSLDAFCENRYLEGPYPKKKYKMSKEYTAKEAALVLLWNCLVNPTVNDVTRAGDWERSVLDTVPNTAVSDSTKNYSGTRKKRWLEGGQMYPQLLDLLRQNKLGIRTIRPTSGPTKIVSVTTGDKGLLNFADFGKDAVNRLRWDIYNGVDRRLSAPDSKEVVFHYESGHLDDPEYLWAIDNYKTMAFVISDAGVNRIYRDRSGDRNLSGLDRRVVWVDGGELGDLRKIPDADDQRDDETDAEFRQRVRNIKAANAADREEFKENLVEKGEVELEKADRVELFDAKVSASAPYEYRTDYYLGDKVTLLGQYDFKQTMIVSEYVRTEDAEGDRGFPGLVTSLD